MWLFRTGTEGFGFVSPCRNGSALRSNVQWASNPRYLAGRGLFGSLLNILMPVRCGPRKPPTYAGRRSPRPISGSPGKIVPVAVRNYDWSNTTGPIPSTGKHSTMVQLGVHGRRTTARHPARSRAGQIRSGPGRHRAPRLTRARDPDLVAAGRIHEGDRSGNRQIQGIGTIRGHFILL